MDILILKYFETVAKEEHMGRAAEKLHITQPSLSTAIRRLEAELGYTLFDRVGKGIELNEYGRIYLRAVSSALNELGTAMEEMKVFGSNNKSLVKLSCSGSLRNSHMIDYLLNEGFFLQLTSIPKDLEEALNSRQSDLIITMGRTGSNLIEYDELATHELVFVVGKSHPLAKRKDPMGLDVLRHHLFCSTDTPNSMLNVFRELRHYSYFRPTVAFYGRNSTDLLKVIMAGRYVGLMVKEHLPDTDELVILPINESPFIVPIFLYWRKGNGIEAEVQAVRHEIIDFYASYTGDSLDLTEI